MLEYIKLNSWLSHNTYALAIVQLQPRLHPVSCVLSDFSSVTLPFEPAVSRP